jgi:hypothetical protein
MKGRYHLGERGVDGVKLFKMYLKYDVKAWIGFIWLRIGSVETSFEHGNISSGSIVEQPDE